MDARQKKVFVAIVVVVADRYAGIISSSSKSGLFGDVGKMALAVIFKEEVVILRGVFAECRYIGAIREENIKLTIVVVVENCDAAGHRFRGMVLGSFAAVECEIDRLKGEIDRPAARSCIPSGSVKCRLGVRRPRFAYQQEQYERGQPWAESPWNHLGGVADI